MIWIEPRRSFFSSANTGLCNVLHGAQNGVVKYTIAAVSGGRLLNSGSASDLALSRHTLSRLKSIQPPTPAAMIIDASNNRSIMTASLLLNWALGKAR